MASKDGDTPEMASTIRLAATKSELRRQEEKKRVDANRYLMKHFAIVGVDFGTTNSAAAYVTTESIARGTPIIRRVALDNSQYFKVPTAILEDPTTKKVYFGEDALQKFADELEDSLVEDSPDYKGCLFRLFKPDIHTTPRKQFCESVRFRSGTSGVGKKEKLLDIVAKTLNYIKERAAEAMSVEHKGPTFLATKIVWVLTVPAIWTLSDQQFLCKAAVKAGMANASDSENLRIALEPECAAIHMKSICGLLEKDSKFIVLDAGGGTTDISALRVEKETPLTMKPLARPLGINKGGDHVNANFMYFLRDHIITKTDASLADQPKVQHDIQKQFERNKRTAARAFRIGLGEVELKDELKDAGQRVRNVIKTWAKNANKHWTGEQVTGFGSALRMPIDYVEKRFADDVLNGIEKLLKDNMAHLKDAEYVILAGGFSASTFLVDRIKKICDRAGWTLLERRSDQRIAIVMGAVRYGMNLRVFPSRMSRWTYGIITSTEWKDARHSAEYAPDGTTKTREAAKKFYSNELKQDRAADTWKKFVTINEEVGIDEVRKHVVYPEHYGQEYASIQLWRTTKPDPVHLKDLHNDFQCTGELKVKLPTIGNGGGATKSADVKLDVVFIQDCTGSMEHHIAKVNDTIKALMTKVQADFPGSDVRFAFVGYRDSLVCDDDDVECIDFLDTKEALPKFQKHLADIEATGGGDQCEDVLAGLKQAVNLPGWRKDADLKLAFHIADAPTHGDFFNHEMVSPPLDWVKKFDEDGKCTKAVLKIFCEENIELIHVRINRTTDAMIKTYNRLMKSVDPRKEIQTINIEAPNYEVSAAKMVGVVTQRVSHGLASVEKKQLLSRYQQANAIRIEMKFGPAKLVMSAKRVEDNTPVEITVDFESGERVRDAGPATKMSDT